MKRLGFLLAAVLLCVGFAPSRAQAAPSPASSYLASCAQSASTLSALFVFDQSGSLTGTDPGGVRYEALRVAIEQLSRMTSSRSQELAVEAAVASFDHQYHAARDTVKWAQLDVDAFDGDSAKQRQAIELIMKTAMERTAPAGGTDFEAALDGALADMKDRAGPETCRVVFWFTDGQFESARDSVDAARGRMCQRGGLLDRIRQSGIVLVGIQLAADSADLLPMSEGKAPGGGTCGTTPIPSDWAPGMYLRADDTASLKRIFGSVVDLVQGCTPVTSKSGRIDPGIRRFRATIDTPSKVRALRLDAPDGTSINAPLSGSAEEAGYRISVASDDHYITFEVSMPPNRGDGVWGFSTDPATTAADKSLCVFHDLHLELADPKQQINAGGKDTVEIKAVISDGTVADLSVFKGATAGASAVGPDGKIRKAAAQIIKGRLLVSFESLPTDARIDLSVALELSTASGLTLAPLSGRFPLAMVLSKEFPLVRPVDRLDLGTAVKTKPTSETLDLVGSSVGPTKVCFGQFASVVVPQEVQGTIPTVSDQCVELKVSESRQVTVEVRAPEAAEGAGSAVLPVVLHGASKPDRPSQQVRFDLPVQWRFSNPLNAPVAIAVLLVVGVLSVLLPLLAMGLANLVSAKFDTKHLQGGQVSVNVRDGRARRAGAKPDSRLIDVYKDRDHSLRVTNSRRFNIGGVEFRARGTLNPFGAPKFTATAPPGHKIMSTVGMPHAGDRVASVSPGIGFTAVVTAADRDLAANTAEVKATVIFLIRDSSKFTDAALADRLLNQHVHWERVTDDWRPEPGDRTDALDETTDLSPRPTTRRSNSIDANFFD